MKIIDTLIIFELTELCVQLKHHITAALLYKRNISNMKNIHHNSILMIAIVSYINKVATNLHIVLSAVWAKYWRHTLQHLTTKT